MEDNEQNPKASANPNAPQTKTVKKKKVVVGYGYGNGGYGGYGGYGAGGYGGYGNAPVAGGGAVMPNRTLRDYLMILRERIWYIIVTFFVIFAGILLYTFRMTPMYTSVATVQILRDSDVPIDGPGGVQRSHNDIVSNVEDFNTQVKLMESFEVISAVQSAPQRGRHEKAHGTLQRHDYFRAEAHGGGNPPRIQVDYARKTLACSEGRVPPPRPRNSDAHCKSVRH